MGTLCIQYTCPKSCAVKLFGNVGLSNFQTVTPPLSFIWETLFEDKRKRRKRGQNTFSSCKMDIHRTENYRIAMCYFSMLLYLCDWSFACCYTSLKGVEYCPETVFLTKWRKGGVGDYLFFIFLPWSLGSLALNSNLNWVHSFILWTSSYFNTKSILFQILINLTWYNEILGPLSEACWRLARFWYFIYHKDACTWIRWYDVIYLFW